MDCVGDFGAVFFDECDAFDMNSAVVRQNAVDFSGFSFELSAHDFDGVSFVDGDVAFVVFFAEFCCEWAGEGFPDEVQR